MLTIFHAEKPKDVQKSLQAMLTAGQVIKLREGEELSGVLRLAMAMGTAEDVAKIQDAQSKINRRRKSLRYLENTESSEES